MEDKIVWDAAATLTNARNEQINYLKVHAIQTVLPQNWKMPYVSTCVFRLDLSNVRCVSIYIIPCVSHTLHRTVFLYVQYVS